MVPLFLESVNTPLSIHTSHEIVKDSQAEITDWEDSLHGSLSAWLADLCVCLLILINWHIPLPLTQSQFLSYFLCYLFAKTSWWSYVLLTKLLISLTSWVNESILAKCCFEMRKKRDYFLLNEQSHNDCPKLQFSGCLLHHSQWVPPSQPARAQVSNLCGFF